MQDAMKGKVVVVTGATSGVGRETARGLARMGATLVLAVRDVAKGEAVAEELAREPGAAGKPMVLRLDLADFASVRAFAQAYPSRFDRLDVLVNNAGIHTARHRLTVDGHEGTFQANHLGHFLLTNLLLDMLKRSAPARVVNVASEAHRFVPGGGGVRWERIDQDQGLQGIPAYTQSKLANVQFTLALARRLESTRVTANAVHPGSVRSNWARGAESGLFRYAAKLSSPFLISPEKGARTSLYAATAPELEGVSGRYLVRCKASTPSRAARDVDAQERLWRESLRMTGLVDVG